MSGGGDSKESYFWTWGHILWQRRGIRLEEFCELPHNVQLAYIASEQLEDKNPVNAQDRLAKAYLTNRKNKSRNHTARNRARRR